MIDDVDEFRIPLSNSVLAGDPDKLCALVADARASQIGVADGYYDSTNGNCIPIPA